VIPHAQQGLDYKTSLISWKVNGVKPLRSASFPAKRLDASLLQFQGTGGRSFLVYDNFSAIMRWNRSTYFATAVGLLADAIQKGL
jgi:membrane-bound lytic murein transglycosylase B